MNAIRPTELLTLLKGVEDRGAIETTHRVQQNCGQVSRYAVATGRAESDPSRDLRGALPGERPRIEGLEPEVYRKRYPRQLAKSVVAEPTLAAVLQGRYGTAYIANRDPVLGSVYVVMLMMFVLMPEILAIAASIGRPDDGRGQPPLEDDAVRLSESLVASMHDRLFLWVESGKRASTELDECGNVARQASSFAMKDVDVETRLAIPTGEQAPELTRVDPRRIEARHVHQTRTRDHRSNQCLPVRRHHDRVDRNPSLLAIARKRPIRERMW